MVFLTSWSRLGQRCNLPSYPLNLPLKIEWDTIVPRQLHKTKNYASPCPNPQNPSAVTQTHGTRHVGLLKAARSGKIASTKPGSGLLLPSAAEVGMRFASTTQAGARGRSSKTWPWGVRWLRSCRSSCSKPQALWSERFPGRKGLEAMTTPKRRRLGLEALLV